jgi:hypothetical protein
MATDPHPRESDIPERSPEPTAWRLPGAGMYGSDVEVVGLDAYRRLAVEADNAIQSCLRWAESADKAKARLSRAVKIGERLQQALAERRDDQQACVDWDELMADEFVEALKEMDEG